MGRFLSVDPLTRSYPWYTPYQFAGNTPIAASDIDGLEPKYEADEGTIDAAPKQGSSDISNRNWIFMDCTWQETCVSRTPVITFEEILEEMTPEYESNLSRRLESSAIKFMILGMSSTGNNLYGEQFRPEKVLELKENQKQDIFYNSTNKTIAILWSEFVEGIGKGDRFFDSNTPITRDIAGSVATDLFMNWFMTNITIQDGSTGKHTIFTSPDNAEHWSDALRAHAQGIGGANRAGFWTGSLDYYWSVQGNILSLRVHNHYTLDSGVTRNQEDNMLRVPGHRSPLGTTNQWFIFSTDLNTYKK